MLIQFEFLELRVGNRIWKMLTPENKDTLKGLILNWSYSQILSHSLSYYMDLNRGQEVPWH